jgi:hypothetical protein
MATRVTDPMVRAISKLRADMLADLRELAMLGDAVSDDPPVPRRAPLSLPRLSRTPSALGGMADAPVIGRATSRQAWRAHGRQVLEASVDGSDRATCKQRL